MLRKSLRESTGKLGIISLLVAVIGCGGSQEEPPTPALSSASRPTTPDVEPLQGEAGSSPATPFPSPATSSSRGGVLASRSLGMVVTGNEAADPNRSIEVLEQHLLSFLPQIEALYEKEREQDPGLLGSLDVNMVIEPDGVVSDLRFPRRRVSSEHLATAAFDYMRTWTFPPAEQRVQFRYTLLFVPPGIDQASIMVWENRLGNRAIVEEVEERRVASVAATSPAPPKEPTPPASEARESRKRPPSAVVPSERPREHSEAPPVIVTGWYRVTSATLLRAAPRSSSEVITRLNRGTRVQVVGAAGGDWLEVRSVRGRAPGFLYRGDVQLEQQERIGQW